MLNGHYRTECDLWSLGVMLYFMLSGRQAFSGKNDPDKEAKILTREPNFAGGPWDNVSPEAKDFVRKLLNKDPHKRLNSKGERAPSAVRPALYLPPHPPRPG